MFHTFQVAEPGEHLPGWQQSGIYDYFTFDKLLSLKSNKLDKNIDKLIDRRIEKMEISGIHVPQDCETLRDAVALVEWNTGRGKYAKYTNKETHAKFVKFFRIPRVGSTLYRPARFSTIVLGKGEHQILSPLHGRQLSMAFQSHSQCMPWDSA